jgi:hypothetical protein
LTGLPFHRPERSTITSWRWPGDVGLKVLSAIVLGPDRFVHLQARRHVDGLTIFERDDCLLDIALAAAMPRKRFTLPLRFRVLTAFTLTENSSSTAFLISGLVAVRPH